MSKISKSIFLNHEICDHLNSIIEHTGVSFSRAVTVALVKLIADGADEHPSYPTWMQATVRLDKGQTSLEEVLRMIREGTT